MWTIVLKLGMSLHLQITLYCFWLQNIYCNLYYKATSLPVLAKLRALPATLFKQGLLELPAIFEQKRWQHRKASVSWLLESPLLVSRSCSVLASHSELCVPLTRWMLADGNTVLLFNYLKCCIQIYLWHSTIEQGVCCPYPIFDRLFHISLFVRLWRWFWFGYLRTYLVLWWVSQAGGCTLAVVNWGYTRDSTLL